MKPFENKVIYQIYPKSFLDTSGNGFGDIHGIRQKLTYIKQLGVDYIWLSPCLTSPQKDNGYDIADYYTIDDRFGTNEEYKMLIQEANAKGMKIMMDLVLNHTSDAHTWFQKARRNDPYYRDFYIWRDQPNELTSLFGGSAWEYDPLAKQYYLHLFDKSQPDLNWENPNVRKALYAMINTWIAIGVEGFRLDVIDLIGKNCDTMELSKTEQFYTYLKELNAQTFRDRFLTVGECWGATIQDCTRMCNAQGLTQAFHFHPLLLTYEQDKFDQHPLAVSALCRCLQEWQNDYDGIEAVVMNNHDQPRLLSLWLDDQAYRMQSAKLLITLFALTKGNLYLYQGEEIGMTNAHFTNIESYRDVETKHVYETMRAKEDAAQLMQKIQRVSRDNARIPMQWNGQKNAGFTKGTPWIDVCANYTEVNVEKDLQDPDGVYAYYQKILRFRKENYAMLCCTSSYTSDGGLLFMERGKIHVIANFTPQSIPYTKPAAPLFQNYEAVDVTKMRPYEVIMWVL